MAPYQDDKHISFPSNCPSIPPVFPIQTTYHTMPEKITDKAEMEVNPSETSPETSSVKPAKTTTTLTAEPSLPHTGSASITRMSNPVSHFVLRQYTSGEFEVTSNRRIKRIVTFSSPKSTWDHGKNTYYTTKIEVDMYDATTSSDEDEQIMETEENTELNDKQNKVDGEDSRFNNKKNNGNGEGEEKEDDNEVLV